jgi:polysaccharide deacetylase family protein (PEP-CTERM system associated)
MKHGELVLAPVSHGMERNETGQAVPQLPYVSKVGQYLREVEPNPIADAQTITDGLSIDVEDYFHVEAFAERIRRDKWATFTPRVHDNCDRILRLLQQHGWAATFFVLGWVAERDPALVREIAQAGHEIACHSYSHRPVSTLRPEEFREDLRRARDSIEKAVGSRIIGYRAPTFSIVRRSIWAIEILAEEGFHYDSSVFPIRHDLYGFPEFPRFAQRIELPSGREIFEFPMSTIRLGGMNFPFGGGGYLRLLPMVYTLWAIERLHRKEKQPFVLYLHPWELDPNQPRCKAGWKSELRHYTGLDRTEARLAILLAQYRFETLKSLLARMQNSVPTLNLSTWL